MGLKQWSLWETEVQVLDTHKLFFASGCVYTKSNGMRLILNEELY